jgi:phosphonate transport system substrate-binding protein
MNTAINTIKLRKTFFWNLLAIGSGLSLLIQLGCSRSNDREELKEIVIALEPDRDPESIMLDSGRLQTFLESETGIPVRITVPLSSAVLREGFRNGTVDIGYINSTAAVRLGDAIDVLVATLIDGRPYYESYWLALKDSSYTSVMDLRGKPICFSSRTSTSGFIMPVAGLLKKGLLQPGGHPEDFFGAGNVFYGIGYVSAVERVLDGSVAAAAVSYYVFEQDRHLSAEQRNQLKIVDRQGPVPTHVLAIRSSLPKETIHLLRAALLAFDKKEPETAKRLFGAPLVEVDAVNHLTPTVEALQAIETLRF